MCSMFHLLNGLSDMCRYCLVTHLVEKPSLCLYYKGMEGDNAVSFALNTVVSFTPAEALVFDEETARDLCKRLNQDRVVLLSHGFTEFDIIKITSSI